MNREAADRIIMAGSIFGNKGVDEDGAIASDGLIHDGALVVRGGRIVWVGQRADMAPEFRHLPVSDYGSRLITPSLIDCHTHLIYGGNRAREFEMRLNGASYEDVARAGGGILASVNATRAASASELLESALNRFDQMAGEGVGRIEVKSGYGLDLETELKMLRVARQLGRERPVHVHVTYLGAHAVPPEFAGRAGDYVDFVCTEVLPQIAREGLADAVDGFCETIGFDVALMERVFVTAHELGLPVKLHAEQLSNCGGVALAARFGALSADHLEYLDADGVAAMAESGTVAVLLPGAFYTIRETRVPPVDLLRAAGVPMALATDCNPGSSPMGSILLAMNMGCTLFGLTSLEALDGVTRHGAHALGLDETVGAIAPGARADLCVWNVSDPVELSYQFGFRPLHQRIFGGCDV